MQSLIKDLLMKKDVVYDKCPMVYPWRKLIHLINVEIVKSPSIPHQGRQTAYGPSPASILLLYKSFIGTHPRPLVYQAFRAVFHRDGRFGPPSNYIVHESANLTT